MHTLATSDIAFLLCTALSATSPPKPPGTPGIPPFRLTLTTAYGLRIDVSPTAPSDLSISLVDKSQPTHSSKKTFMTLPPSPPSRQRPHTPNSQISTLYSPITPPPSPPSLQQPTSTSTSTNTPLKSNLKFRLSPSFHTSTFLWQISSPSLSPGLPARPVTEPESLLPHHSNYHPTWHSAYLDWTDRAETLEARYLVGFESEQEEENEEGERILWMVEGVLLAAWLALQENVDGVEYRPWGEALQKEGKEEEEEEEEGYWLDKKGVTEGVKRVLRDVGV
ncbi:hypothetical protein QBC44DRAFT_30929 [Cladorrhinum sp. PSN332]|nr:hypothetical protein QBC44DRAFT_30929 [Cladorrhinum sp. PSN332]